MSSLFFTAPSATSEGLGASMDVQSQKTLSSTSLDQEVGNFANVLSVAIDQSQVGSGTSSPTDSLSSSLQPTTTHLSSAPIGLNSQSQANQLSLLLKTSDVSSTATLQPKLTGLSFGNQWKLEQSLVSDLPMAEQVSNLANWIESFATGNKQTGQLSNLGKMGQILPKIVKSIQAKLTSVELARLNLQVTGQQLIMELDQTEIQLPLLMFQESDFDPQLVAHILTAKNHTVSRKNDQHETDLLTPVQLFESVDSEGTGNEIEPASQFGHPSLMTVSNLGVTNPIKADTAFLTESSSHVRAEIFSTFPSTQMTFRFEAGRSYLNTEQVDWSTIQAGDDQNQLGFTQSMIGSETNELEVTNITESLLIDEISQLHNVGPNSLSEDELQQAASQIQRLATNLAEKSLRPNLSSDTSTESEQIKQFNVVFGLGSDKLAIAVPGSSTQISVSTATDLPMSTVADWVEKISTQKKEALVEKPTTTSSASLPSISFGLDLSSMEEVEVLPVSSTTIGQMQATQQILGHLASAIEQSIVPTSDGLLQVSVPKGIEQVAMGARLQVEANDSSVSLTFQSENPVVLSSVQRSLQSSLPQLNLSGQQQSAQTEFANSIGLEAEVPVESVLNRLNVSSMRITSYDRNTVPEGDSVSFMPNQVIAGGSVKSTNPNFGNAQNPLLATSNQLSTQISETNFSDATQPLTVRPNLSSSTSMGAQASNELEPSPLSNGLDINGLPLDAEIESVLGERLGRQNHRVSNPLLGGNQPTVTPTISVNSISESTETISLTGTTIGPQVNSSTLGQSFDSQMAFGQNDGSNSNLTEDEFGSTESDSFTTVLEQENEIHRMEFLSTAPQKQVSEMEGVSPQDEVSSQFAEVRRVREARQDIIREIQSLQADRRQESDREMTIQLQPARLGRLMVRVSQSRDLDGNSAVAVQIQASSTEAQQLLMNELSDLKSDFLSQGIDLTGLEVSVDSGRNFHQSRSQGLFFADYQRQMRSGGNLRSADPPISSIRSSAGPSKVGTQYANNQLNLVI